MAKDKGGREFLEWDNKRGSSDDRLNRIPSITTTLINDKRYYSTVDAELFFGNIYIDEVTEIQWTLTQNTLPLFGYNSYCFDDIALGTRMVQGQFAINYTKANFLGVLQSSSGFAEIARRQYGKDYAETSYFSDYRKRLNLPQWDKGFDLVVGYGYHQTEVGKVRENETSSFAVIDCCQITGSSQRLSYIGEPVQEIYTFIARDIKYTQASETDSNPSEGSDTSGGNIGTEVNLSGEINLEKNEIIITSNDNVTFRGTGTLSLTYPFKDKTLQAEMEISTKVTFARVSLTENMSNKIIKELKDKNVSNISASYLIDLTLAEEKDPVNFTRSGQISLAIV